MFGIDFSDIKMKSGHYLKFSTNAFTIESSSSFTYDILVKACLILKQTFAAQDREACQTNFVFHWLELLRSWTVGLRHLHDTQLQQRLPNQIKEKISKRRRVSPGRGQQ